MKSVKKYKSKHKMPIVFCLLVVFLSSQTLAGSEDVLVFGDSLMKLVSRSIEKQMDRNPNLDATSIVSIGSGLARMDLFDWNGKIDNAVSKIKPRVAVVMIGANDNQPMRTDSGVVRLGTDSWKTEYQNRVTNVIDILTAGGVKKIYWIGLPDVRKDELQKDLMRINDIIIAAAKKNSEVEFIDTTEMFSIKKGQFSPYILDKKTGMPVHVRSSDGVHLNREGAEMLAGVVLEKIRQ